MKQLSSTKFRSLSPEHQHRLCCKLLRLAFENGDLDALRIYEEICEWLSLERVVSESKEEIANRFHWHLKQSGRGLKEPTLLQSANQRDSRDAKAAGLPIHTYLDHIRSAHNVGSILRTIDAFHLGRVYFSTQMCTVNDPQVHATSMGAHEWVSMQTIQDIEQLPRPLYALETTNDALSVYDFVFPSQCTLAIGNEEYGCSQATLQQADAVLSLPMYGRKNSLNVANAFAAVASEIRRQYNIKQKRDSIHG